MHNNFFCFTCRDLDYDFIGPEHRYEFTITATDRDPVSPKSGSVTVQVSIVWIKEEEI